MKVSENKEVTESLTSLKIQVDRDGQAHSFADAKKTWKFTKPLPVVDLVETYKGVLANVVMELKGLKELASWYVIAFVFNIFGSILGYFADKDDHQNMANHLLIVGFISLFLIFILGFLGFISLVW